MSNLWKIATLIVIGAILYDVLTHPAGTKALGSSVQGLWVASLKQVSGR